MAVTRVVKLREKRDEYYYDVERIIEAFRVLENAKIDYETAKKAWELYSDSMACGWCALPDTLQEIVWLLDNYIVIEEVEEST